MTSPQDPGNPEATDEQNLSPDQAEEAASARANAEEIEDAELVEDGAGVEGAEGDLEAEVEAPAEPTIEEQLAERTEDLQRVSAEYANYRRRSLAEREQTIAQAKASVISSLLPVLDDLDLAKQHGDLEEGSPLRAFSDKFSDALKANKLEAFGEEGDAFDPEIHEAVQDLSSGDEKTLGTVLRKGYRVGDRLVRTAMVIIADAEVDAEADSGTESTPESE